MSGKFVPVVNFLDRLRVNLYVGSVVFSSLLFFFLSILERARTDASSVTEVNINMEYLNKLMVTFKKYTFILR